MVISPRRRHAAAVSFRSSPITVLQLATVLGLPLAACWGLLRSSGDASNRNLVVADTETGVVDATPLATSGAANSRLRETFADKYFDKHKALPKPSVMHATLPRLQRRLQQSENNESIKESSGEDQPRVLVIGDVHGCFQELLELHNKAVQEENEGEDFDAVVLVGDLCNKGPQSTQVIRWVRTTPNWYAVRGNHDDGALAAALGDESKAEKKKYKWIREQQMQTTTVDDDAVILSDEDVQWMAELPYTIKIPGSYFSPHEPDTVVVHAGLVPLQELQGQDIATMITMREMTPLCHDMEDPTRVTKWNVHEREKGNAAHTPQDADNPTCEIPVPWASVWKGPQRIVFGHDAKRGLQQYEGDWAIGLDTGAVYGKELTGVILPERKLVSISTKEYCPVGNEAKK